MPLTQQERCLAARHRAIKICDHKSDRLGLWFLAMAPKAPADTSLRSQVYDSLLDALTAGRFTPGQKLSFRFIAGTLGVSLTPVREAIRRLVAEGALEMRPNRSEEHTSELQSPDHLVCRLLLEKKKNNIASLSMSRL